MDTRWIGIMFYTTVCMQGSVVEPAIHAHKHNETEMFDDFASTFGPDIGRDGISGVLFLAKPYDACSKVEPPPLGPHLEQNITVLEFALISRGKCDFGLKVLNAQLAGYKAAIVHNVGSNELIRMSTGEPISSAIYIPSVFIGEKSAVRLNSTYMYQDKGGAFIEIEENQFNPLDYYLIPFVVVIAVCFVSLLCFLLIKCQCDRRRARRGRLSLQRLKKLPVKKYDKGDEYDVCAICLEDYEEGDTLRILPCAHAYHCKCVDPWLTTNKRLCPLCKRRVLSNDGSGSSSSDNEGGDSSADEHTPLVPSSVAASPNAPMYATGYRNRNPFAGRLLSNRRASTASDDTTSTDTSDTELVSAHRFPPKRAVADAQPKAESPCSSGLQSRRTRAPRDVEPEIFLAMGGHEPADADTYLDSAEAMMAGPSRISESSIAVLSDINDSESTPEPHSFSSQEFHSVDESMIVAQTPFNLESRASAVIGSDNDEDGVVVIARGSRAEIYGDDSEV